MKQSTRKQPCLVCGGKDRFHWFKDWRETGGAICNHCGAGNGLTWVMRVLDCSYLEACKTVEKILGVGPDKANYQQQVDRLRQQQEKRQAQDQARMAGDKQKRLDNLFYLGCISRQLERSQPALNYLRQRGLGELIDRQDLPPGWRVVPSLKYYQCGKATAYPCLVGPVQQVNDELVNVHRTYITSEGRKAPVLSSKKLMPPVYPGATKGAAIRLWEAGFSLALSEGIETALAVRVMNPGLPVWPAISAIGLESIQLPPRICNVEIFADKDRSQDGQKAAQNLKDRLESQGRVAEIHLPPLPIPEGEKGIDWLDVLNQREEAA